MPLKEREGEEGQGKPRGVQWRKREKNWTGTVGERQRLLPETDVNGVFCCTASCVLRGVERKSKLTKRRELRTEDLKVIVVGFFFFISFLFSPLFCRQNISEMTRQIFLIFQELYKISTCISLEVFFSFSSFFKILFCCLFSAPRQKSLSPQHLKNDKNLNIQT